MKNKDPYSKLWKISLILVFFAGIAIRLIVVTQSALSLDQRMSLFFSDFFSFEQLSFNFQNDIHPGGYYMLLKFFLSKTRSQTLLTLATSTIPEIASITILIFFFLNKVKASYLATSLTAFLLLINPFFIQVNSQLRMYGLLTSLSIFSYISYELWIKEKQLRYFILLSVFLFLGSYVSYTMFFLIGGILINIAIKKQIPTPKKIISLLSLSLLVIAQFSLVRGFSSNIDFQSQFNHASWIPKPDLVRSISIFLTSFGFSTNINSTSEINNTMTPGLAIVIFVTSGFFLFKNSLHKIIKSSIFNHLLTLIIIPSVTIIAVSFLLPMISNLRFFYRFSLDVSLMIPRIFLPLIVGASILLFRKADNYLQISSSNFQSLSLIILFAKYSIEEIPSSLYFFIVLLLLTSILSGNISMTLSSKKSESFSK